MTESRVDEAGRFYRRPQQRPRPDVVADCCPLLSFDPTYQTRWMEDGAAIWYTNRFPSIISIVCQSPPIPTGLLRNDSKILPRFFRASSEILPRFFRDSFEMPPRFFEAFHHSVRLRIPILTVGFCYIIFKIYIYHVYYIIYHFILHIYIILIIIFLKIVIFIFRNKINRIVM